MIEEMKTKCYFHPQKDALHNCRICKKSLCDECFSGRYCWDCFTIGYIRKILDPSKKYFLKSFGIFFLIWILFSIFGIFYALSTLAGANTFLLISAIGFGIGILYLYIYYKIKIPEISNEIIKENRKLKRCIKKSTFRMIYSANICSALLDKYGKCRFHDNSKSIGYSIDIDEKIKFLETFKSLKFDYGLSFGIYNCITAFWVWFGSGNFYLSIVIFIIGLILIIQSIITKKTITKTGILKWKKHLRTVSSWSWTIKDFVYLTVFGFGLLCLGLGLIILDIIFLVLGIILIVVSIKPVINWFKK
ncbi:MAG: hypothetical protein ACE5KE_01495 [Methanosarcinales archaeon]